MLKGVKPQYVDANLLGVAECSDGIFRSNVELQGFKGYGPSSMTKLSPNRAAITRFVREVLGCNCPDSVFRQVTVRRGSTAVRSCRVDYEIRFGDRLLIIVTSSPEELAPTSRLENVIGEGKQARDNARLNRFRLVVVTTNTTHWREELLRLFGAISSRDEKTHLHVIESNEMPDLFKRPEQKP